MFWTYYSAVIFLFGAELTKAVADGRTLPGSSMSQFTPESRPGSGLEQLREQCSSAVQIPN